MATKKDWLFAGAAGGVFTLLILFFGVAGPDPSTWTDFAEVAGLRPPRELLPGLWRLLVGWTFGCFGVGPAMAVGEIIGALAAGASLVCFYLTAKLSLVMLPRFSTPMPLWRHRLAPAFALLATVLLGASSPFWRISQVFCNDQLHWLLTIVGMYLSLRWIVVGGKGRVCLIFLLLGILAAETPVGLVIPLVLIAAYRWTWRGMVNGQVVRWPAFVEPIELPKWRMFFCFLIGLCAVMALNAWHFLALGGAEANGWDVVTTYARSAIGCFRAVWNAASVLGWMLGLSFSVLPFVVALKVFPSVVCNDCPLGFRRGLIMFLSGFLALLQSGLFASTRFWTFVSDEPIVTSGYLLVMFVALAMFATALFLSAFAFAGTGKFVVQPNEDGLPAAVRVPSGRIRHLMPAISAGIVLIVLCRLPKSVEREVMSTVNAVVEEIVAECRGVRWLFTDGRLDPAIELAAAANGQELTLFNMLAEKNDWEVYVRTRSFAENGDDYLAAETGAPMLLRRWVDSNSNELSRSAIMLGFEFWRQAKRPLPQMSGLIARDNWENEVVMSNGVVTAEAIAKRVVDIAPAADLADLSPGLASAFSAVNWRLARSSHFRRDDELGDDLDHANSALERMIAVIDSDRQRAFMQVTPREGVKLALYRTNFSDGVRYAAIVLNQDELDPESNFLMGMNAVQKRNYAEAELYLRKCLQRRPKEPAVLNNLSIVCRKQRKFKEAEEFARKAIALLPNSAEVKRTLSDALKRMP